MLKIDFHTHTADDPCDRIPHTTIELIDRAASLGYDGLAVTLHNRQLDIRPLASHAAERGLILIAGIERTIERRHVLLLNFRRGAEEVRTFEDLARLREREPGLVIAPHPFFPGDSCLGADLDRYADLFDAVEWNAMYTSGLNFNRRLEEWAIARGKPVVGNGDIHRLRQLDTCFSMVDATPDADAICAAVKAGRVQRRSRPLAWHEAAAIMTSLFAARGAPRFRKKPSTARSRPQLAS
jgi:predicted metal-dependent phosphoesterase TrpH